jgi:hypothetical protein
LEGDEKMQKLWTDEESKKLIRLRKKGTSCSKIAKKLGRSKSSVEHKLYSISHPKSTTKRVCTHKHDTLCWNCQNACCGCSWSREFLPVAGWKAEPSILTSITHRSITSYDVISCPQYLPDERSGNYNDA